MKKLTLKQAKHLATLPAAQPYPLNDQVYRIATGVRGANNSFFSYKLPKQACPCCAERSDNTRFLDKAVLWALSEKGFIKVVQTFSNGLSISIVKNPVIDQIKNWFLECDVDEDELQDVSAFALCQGVEKRYCGGLDQFIIDSLICEIN